MDSRIKMMKKYKNQKPTTLEPLDDGVEENMAEGSAKENQPQHSYDYYLAELFECYEAKMLGYSDVRHFAPKGQKYQPSLPDIPEGEAYNDGDSQLPLLLGEN